MLQQARFRLGVAAFGQLPRDSVCEVALAGRSNAGKSSALNALTNRRKLAFTSKTPGRTQEINYYDVSPGRYVVDLPGYGYAKVSAAVQQRWQRLLVAYLQRHEALRALVIIMDIRHPLTELDCQLLDWFSATRRPILILLTKADKLGRQQQTRQLMAVREHTGTRYPDCEVRLFSSVSGQGVAEARAFIEGILRSPAHGMMEAAGRIQV